MPEEPRNEVLRKSSQTLVRKGRSQINLRELRRIHYNTNPLPLTCTADIADRSLQFLGNTAAGHQGRTNTHISSMTSRSPSCLTLGGSTTSKI